MVDNLGLTGVLNQLDDHVIIFTIHENDQDLNGDGDTDDQVLHIRDLSNNEDVNLGLSFGSDNPIVSDPLTALYVDERGQRADLNGDGDTEDSVLHIYDHSTEETTNLGVYGRSVQLDGNLIVLAVRENSQGNIDLNDDGDTHDEVLHIIELTEDELFCEQPKTAYDSVIKGTDNDDILQGTKGNDLIFGNNGNDLIYASNGNDCIFGGSGNDTIFGEDGDDVLFGAIGNDVLNGDLGNDHLMDDNGDDVLDGGEGDDLCFDKYGDNSFVHCEI